MLAVTLEVRSMLTQVKVHTCTCTVVLFSGLLVVFLLETDQFGAGVILWAPNIPRKQRAFRIQFADIACLHSTPQKHGGFF